MELMKKSLDFILLDDEASSSQASNNKTKANKSKSDELRFKLKRKTKVKSGIEERQKKLKIDPEQQRLKLENYRNKLEEKHKTTYDKILEVEMHRINGPKLAIAKYNRQTGNVLGPEMKKKKRKSVKKNVPFFTDEDFKNIEGSVRKSKKKLTNLEDD